MRIAPGDAVGTVLAQLRRAIDDEVELRIVSAQDPSPVSPTDGEQFALVATRWPPPTPAPTSTCPSTPWAAAWCYRALLRGLPA